MLNTSFPNWPSFTLEEADVVKEVLLSNKVNYWTGDETKKFEKEFAEYIGTEYAIALSNGTLALDLALHALDLGCGDEVIVTPRSFIASVSTVVNAGAKPVFADVDRNSQNISAETIAPVITSKTRAILVVHLAGMPAEMDAITALADQHGLFVIEDCAQAHGAQYKGRSVGSIGHIGTWSFCQDKIMTTGGEGGMVTTNDAKLWSKMWSYKDHGKSWEAVYERKHAEGFRWVHDSFGTNWRMLEIQGAIGRIQTRRLPEWSNIRRSNAEAIWDVCRKMSWLNVPDVPEYMLHGAYKAYVVVNPANLPQNWNRDRILSEFAKNEVPAYPGSCSEIYLEKAFDGTDLRPANRLANARYLGDNSIMFLVHPTLESEHINRTISVINSVNQLVEF